MFRTYAAAALKSDHRASAKAAGGPSMAMSPNHEATSAAERRAVWSRSGGCGGCEVLASAKPAGKRSHGGEC
mgnify:CR=1 FL=1